MRSRGFPALAIGVSGSGLDFSLLMALTNPLPVGISGRYRPVPFRACRVKLPRVNSPDTVERNPAMAYRSAETIDDLLADSLIQKVMLADHVEPKALKPLLDRTARRLADSRRAGVVQ